MKSKRNKCSKRRIHRGRNKTEKNKSPMVGGLKFPWPSIQNIHGSRSLLLTRIKNNNNCDTSNFNRLLPKYWMRKAGILKQPTITPGCCNIEYLQHKLYNYDKTLYVRQILTTVSAKLPAHVWLLTTAHLMTYYLYDALKMGEKNDYYASEDDLLTKVEGMVKGVTKTGTRKLINLCRQSMFIKKSLFISKEEKEATANLMATSKDATKEFVEQLATDKTVKDLTKEGLQENIELVPEQIVEGQGIEGQGQGTVGQGQGIEGTGQGIEGKKITGGSDFNDIKYEDARKYMDTLERVKREVLIATRAEKEEKEYSLSDEDKKTIINEILKIKYYNFKSTSKTYQSIRKVWNSNPTIIDIVSYENYNTEEYTLTINEQNGMAIIEKAIQFFLRDCQEEHVESIHDILSPIEHMYLMSMYSTIPGLNCFWDLSDGSTMQKDNGENTQSGGNKQRGGHTGTVIMLGFSAALAGVTAAGLAWFSHWLWPYAVTGGAYLFSIISGLVAVCLAVYAGGVGAFSVLAIIPAIIIDIKNLFYPSKKLLPEEKKEIEERRSIQQIGDISQTPTPAPITIPVTSVAPNVNLSPPQTPVQTTPAPISEVVSQAVKPSSVSTIVPNVNQSSVSSAPPAEVKFKNSTNKPYNFKPDPTVLDALTKESIKQAPPVSVSNKSIPAIPTPTVPVSNKIQAPSVSVSNKSIPAIPTPSVSVSKKSIPAVSNTVPILPAKPAAKKAEKLAALRTKKAPETPIPGTPEYYKKQQGNTTLTRFGGKKFGGKHRSSKKNKK